MHGYGWVVLRGALRDAQTSSRFAVVSTLVAMGLHAPPYGPEAGAGFRWILTYLAAGAAMQFVVHVGVAYSRRYRMRTV